MFRDPEAVQRRILANIVHVNGCWIWQRGLNNGYGRTQVEGRQFPSHRASYIAFRGGILNDLPLDHLCRIRSCANPDHLEPVTHKENIYRSPIAPAAINASKTHCKRGHEFTPENTYGQKAGRHRMCRVCNRIYHRELWRRLHPNSKRVTPYSERRFA